MTELATRLTRLFKLGINFRAFSGLVTGTSIMLDKVAALCMFSIMGLVVVNVVAREAFNKPILGTYEYVGFLTALMIGLSLAHCAVKKGHIAVDFVMQRFSARTQAITDIFTTGLALSFWSLAAWHVGKYAYSLSLRGVVSPTTQTPFYYFIYLIGFGLFTLGLVIVIEFVKSVEKAADKK